jgi:hypothetical protein
MVLLLLFIIKVLSNEPCVFPSFYWLNNNAFTNENDWPLIEKNQFVKTENFTLCDISWLDLFKIDITIIAEKNILWLLLFQSYCGSVLNQAKITNFLEGLTQSEKAFLSDDVLEFVENEINSLNENIIKAYNLLDKFCERMSDLNYYESKLITISLVKNLSRINNGYVFGFCSDKNPVKDINLDIFTIFQNVTYKDKSEFNNSDLLNLKPLYYNITATQNQFIYDDWVVNIEINKKFALTLILFLITAVFLIIVSTWYHYGNCLRIKNRLSLTYSNEEREISSNTEPSCHRKCFGFCFRICGCFQGGWLNKCCNNLFKKKKANIDDDNFIILEEIEKID